MITTLNLPKSDGQGTETMHSEFLNVGLKLVLNLIGLIAAAELDDDAGHTFGDTLELEG